MSATIILVAAIVLAASTALVHAGGGEEEDDVPLAGAPDKFETGFYNKIQGLINEDASPAATNLRENPDRNQKRAAADVSATYYHVIIQVSGDDREELRLNKASVVDILKAAGARDIVPANVLSFVTASVPVMEIPGLSLFGEVYGLGDGGIPPVSQMDISRRAIRATTADLAGLSDNVINGSGVTMAIIDFGINHISLNSKVDARVYCPTGSCEIDGGNNTSTLSDDHLNALLSHSSTHGTLVSSVVAASGLSAHNGISPGVRLLDGHSMSRGAMVIALDWALTNGADIAQISLIFNEPTCISGYILNKAINQAVSEGMVVVSGAGNDGSSEEGFEYHTVREPSCAQNAISVGGIDGRSTPPILYRASSLGPVSDTIPRLVPHLVAPAVAINLWPSSVSNSSFNLFSGTSFAAPMASAAAAMVLQLNPDLDPAETKSLLLLGTDWTGPVPCTSTQYETTDSSDHCSHAARRDYGATPTLETLNHVGFGVLDVAKSLGYAVNSSSHIVSDNVDSSTRSVLYGLNVTEPLAQTKVLLTWLVPFIFNHNDANFDFTITCPGLDTIRAESDHQTVEFAVFEPAEAGVCAVQVVAKTGSQNFTLASTYPLGPPPSEFVESNIVVSAEDGTYTLNETIAITAEFPRAVKVEGTSKPYLELDVAPTARHAVYTGISANGTVLSFEYVVQDDDATTDLSYASTDALVVPDGGNLTDAQTDIPVRPVLPAPGEAGSLSAARDIVVTTVADTTAPTVSSIERYSPSSATTDSQTLVYEVTFSEDVAGVGTADFALSPGSTGNTTTTNPVTSITGSGDTYRATVTASADGTYNLDLVSSGHGIKDTAENPLTSIVPTTGTDQTYTVDTTAPTISSIERYSPSNATTDSQTLVYEVTFSEDVAGVGTADFALSPSSTGGTGGGGTPEQFTQTRSPSLAISDNTTVSDAITVADSGTATSVTVAVDVTHTYIGDLKIDLVAPDGTTKTVHSRSGGGTDDIDQTYTPDFEGESIAGTWTLRISDNANADSGTLNDWTLTINHGSGTTTNPVTSISGSGDTYYVTVSSTQDGTYNLDLVSSGHGIADESSNPLTDTTPTGADETYTVSTTITDTTAPTISSIERYSPSNATTDSQTLVYEVTFSEDVAGVGTADFALSPSSTGGTGGGGTPEQFTQTRSPSLAIPDNTTVSDAITVADSGTATSVTVAVDVTHTYISDLKIDLVAPDGTTKTVHSRSGGGTDDIDQTYTPDFEGESIAGTWTLRISDNVNFDSGTLNDWTLTINHGSGTTINPVTSISGSGDTYYVTVSSTQDGTYNLDLVSSGHGIADESSSPLTDTTPTGADETYTVSTTITDTTAPTISSIERYSPSNATTDSQTLVYEVTFSEDVAGVGTADFALSPGSTGGTSTSSGQFTQTRSPSLAIPDNTTVSDAITVADSGTATSVTVAVDVTHTYIGDLKIDLVAPDGTTKTVHSRSGGGTDDIDQTYTPDFEGESIAGTWTLRISDNANADSGTLNDWTLTINHGSGTTTNPVTSISGSGDTYYVTVSSTQDGTYNLDLVSSGHGIADESSNPLTDTTPTGADETYTVSTTITDTTAPTISSIERYSPSNATTDSQTLVYEVTFSEDVAGVGTADFALSPGSTGNTTTTNPVTSITGSGDTYRATVTASADGTYNLDLVSSGHGIKDTAENPLTDTTPTGADETYTVSTTITDTTAPTISSIERYSPSNATTDSQTLVYEVTFSEDVAGVGTADFALSPGSTGNTTTTNPVTSITGSGDTYRATVTASADGTYNLDLVSSGHGIKDTAENPLTSIVPTTGTDQTYTVDTTVVDDTAPALASIQRYDPADQDTDSQTLVYEVTFSEDVAGVGTADFALSPGSTGGTSTSSGQFTQTRSPALAITQANTISDTITVSDSGTATSVTVAVDVTHTYIGDLKIDLVAPDGTTKTVHSRSGGGTDDINQTYTPDFEGESIAGTWTLRINDNYAAADNGILNSWTLTINHGSTSTASPVTSVSGSGDTYYVTVSSTQDGTYNLDLVSSGHGIADESSNPLTDTTPTGADETYTVSTTITDTTAPTISSIERYSPSNATTDSQTLVYRITFSEDVAGVGTADFALSPGSTGNTTTTNPVTSITGSGDTYRATVTASADGTYNLDLVSSGHGIKDTAENPLTDTTPTGADETYTVSTTITDTTAPTISSIERYSPSNATTDSQTLVYEVTFSEDVAGVGTADFALSPGSTGGTGGGGTSEQFTQTRSPALAITQANTISDTVTVSDSGTATSVSVAVDVTHTYIGDLKIDLVAPDGTTKTVHNRSGGDTDDIDQTYTPDFEGESIAGTWTLRINDNYAAADNGILNSWTLTINHGSTSTASPVTSVSGSGDTYYVTVSSTQDGTYNLDLVSSGHGIADESSNPLTDTTPTGADETYTVSTTITDTTAPTISSIERYSPSNATTDSQTLVYRITFSEDVAGVGTADFALSPGSTGNTTTTNPVTSITGSGDTYRATVTASADGTYNLDLASSGHGIKDTAENPLTSIVPTTGTDQTYTVDTTVVDDTAPALASIQRYDPAGQDTDSQTLVYEVTFSEDVAGVGTADFALSPGSTGNTTTTNPVTSITGSGDTYRATVTASADGTYNLDLVPSGHGIKDTAENPLTDTTPTGADETYTVSTTITDTTAPTISSIERYSPSSATTDRQTLIYEVTFSEAVTGVDAADFALSSSSTGGTSGGGTSSQFTQTRSPALAITQANTISDTIAVSDSGTATSVSVAVDVTHTYIGDLKIDLVAPDGTTKTVHSRSGSGTDDIDQTYTPDFAGESIAGAWTLRINDNYAAADDGTLNSWTLTINHGSSNGTASPVTSISGSGDTYYAIVSATTDGTYNLDLVSSGHGIADESSNPLTGTSPTGADHTYTVGAASV